MSKKILVAESSKLIKNCITQILQEKGYEIFSVNDGFDAIANIKTEKPDCILCSINLPVLNGLEVSKIVKNRKNLNIPVILYTITDELYPDSILNNSRCDKFINFDTEYPEDLTNNIAYILHEDSIEPADELEELDDAEESPKPKKIGKIKTENKDKDSKEAIISGINEITGFYQKENEYLNIINAIVTIYEISTLPQEAAIGILDILLNFVPYDIVILSIRSGDYVHDFCRVKTLLSQDEIHDFISVSHDKFLNNCFTTGQIKFLDCIYNLDHSLPETRNNALGKIRSIETGIMFAESFVGTITIGSTKTDIYTEQLSQKFHYFSEKTTPFAVNILDRYRMELNIKNLRKAFSSFVPEEIIDDLTEKANVQTETAGEKRKVAVLICDIRSFTNISEKNKAENVVSFLNDYFTEMVEIIKSHGGSIDKFMGDAIMALFGAPISYEDNAQRAVEAAIDMINKLPEIDSSKLILPEGYEKISIGIGIHYGEVILGSIGCADKKDYTVIGDSVNLASRLEGLTKLYGNHILVSDFVKQELKSSVQIHKLDKVAVKGKKIPVWIYSVENEIDKLSSDYYNSYDKAMDLYEVGAWGLALEYFEKALKIDCNSKAAKLMLDRCREYIVNPPENWDGAVVLTSK